MEPNRNDQHNNNDKKPGGDKPKAGIFTALIVALVLVLIFSWLQSILERRLRQSDRR